MQSGFEWGFTEEMREIRVAEIDTMGVSVSDRWADCKPARFSKPRRFLIRSCNQDDTYFRIGSSLNQDGVKKYGFKQKTFLLLPLSAFIPFIPVK